MTRKVLVINGCSHSVGSEIAGMGINDSRECRNLSFGAQLAIKLGREPIHLAYPGSSNDRIYRSSLVWLGNNIHLIKSREIDPIFLVHWSGVQRTEFRFEDETFVSKFIDDPTNDERYFQINVGTPSSSFTITKRIVDWFNQLFVVDVPYWNDNKIKNIIALQNTLKSLNIKYWFGHAFDTFNSPHLNPNFNSYLKLIDHGYFPYFNDNDMTYYRFCLSKGFSNIDPSGKIWHLGRDAHAFYSDFLYEQFYKLNYASSGSNLN